MLIWALWNNRNEMLFGSERRNPQLIIGSACNLRNEFATVDNGSVRDGSFEFISWTPLSKGVYKLNVDGAIFAKSGSVGLGVIVRDFEGQPIAAASKQVQGQFPAEIVEALAFRFVVGFVRDLSLSKVSFEGDCRGVVEALKLSVANLSSVGLIIEDIQLAVGHGFNSVGFSHVQRTANMVAHGLARFVRNLDDVQIWLEEVPASVRNQIHADLDHCLLL
ncbi:hypothetical protein L1049_022578 [Liquidambar formosana]|uniref:RNase H type-1 domain-containing protein n=1 Tax=Liquidambar formosana TaxID=63359 RepID=A0AAP0RE51_LIQFO